MAAIAPASQEIPRSSSSRAVVVCVDDDPAILRSYGRLLRNEPYDLIMFEDPEKALDRIARADVDLVLSDERMPRMNGTTLIEEVGRRSPRTCCALVTAYPECRTTSARILRLIGKPWDDQDLKEAIRDLLCDRS